MTDRLEQLKRLLHAEPEDAFTLYAVAQEYACRGEHERALEYYDRTIAADANYLYAYFHKARSQEATDDIAGALATLREGLDRATLVGDAHAAGELAGYIDSLDA